MKNEEFIYSGDGIRSAFVADVFSNTNDHECHLVKSEEFQLVWGWLDRASPVVGAGETPTIPAKTNPGEFVADVFCFNTNVHEFPNLSKMRLSQMNNDKYI